MKICYDAVGSKGGKYVALDPFSIRALTCPSIKPNWIIAFTIFNKPIRWQRLFEREAEPRDRGFAEQWLATAQSLLDEELNVPHACEKKAGGLAGVKGGVDRVRKGQVSGTKLV
ncbi:Zinc-binding oxidoreductase alcohol dehydrogenase [Lecanora helva]